MFEILKLDCSISVITKLEGVGFKYKHNSRLELVLCLHGRRG